MPECLLLAADTPASSSAFELGKLAIVGAIGLLSGLAGVYFKGRIDRAERELEREHELEREAWRIREQQYTRTVASARNLISVLSYVSGKRESGDMDLSEWSVKVREFNDIYAILYLSGRNDVLNAVNDFVGTLLDAADAIESAEKFDRLSKKATHDYLAMVSRMRIDLSLDAMSPELQERFAVTGHALYSSSRRRVHDETVPSATE